MAQNKKLQSGALIRLFLLALTLALPALALGGSSISPASAAAPMPPEVAGLSKPSDTAETVVMRVYFRDTAERDRLASELAATEASTRDGFLTVFTERAEYDRVVANLAATGVRYEIDEDQTYFANHPEAIFTSSWDGSPDTFFNGYRTVAENYAYMDALVAAYPNLAEKIDIGDSWCKTHPGVCTQPVAYNGHDLYVLHITNRSIAGPKPVFWFETAIHSREIAGPEMATRYMSQLLDGYNTNPDSRWLVDWHDIWVMPHVNPDGHFIAENGNSTPRTQRKNADKDDGCTAYPPSDFQQFGTDLNRNFSFKWGCCGGSDTDPCSLVYRGSSAGSEEETQAVINKIRSLIPDQRGPNDSDAAPITTTGIYQSLHTYAGLTLYPWGWTAAPSPNNTEMRNIALHTTATNAFPAGNNYEACQGPAPNCLYEVDGDSFDWGYGELGIPSYTTELAGNTFFPNFTTIANLYNQNQGMLTYMAKVARTPYLTTRGPDADTLVANPMTTTAGSPIQLTGRANYNWTGRDQNGAVANLYLQNVAAAEYYIDTPPWAGGTGIPLSPTDGSFNATTEAVQATINTTGLTPGRHIVMVRGRGVNDYGGFQSWGPITAVFIDITGGGATATSTATPVPSTPTASPTVCSAAGNYVYSTATATIVPGTTDIGHHDDEGVTLVTLPFPYTLYDQTFTSVNLSPNGTAEFASAVGAHSNDCLPSGQLSTYTIFAYWDDMRTDGTGNGIFTSVSGSAPNRIFNIEWRVNYFSGGGNANFEIRLYENQQRFDIIHGFIGQGNGSATSGVQKSSTHFTQYYCNGSGNPSANGRMITYVLPPLCATATASSTSTNVPPTGTATSTNTVPPTQTPGGPSATSTATGTNTSVPPTSTSTSVPPTTTSQVSPTCEPGGGPYQIALVLSDDKPSPKLVQYIQADPDVSLITTLDARFTTPDLATLLQYDLIVVYSNTEYDDPVALGNVVADYQDAGGIVVATNANWWGPPYGMEGRWMTGGYSMFNSPAPAENSTSTLGTHDPTHPLMQGVTELTAFFRTQATLATGATQVAAWADNWPLVAYKTTNGHTAVGINAYFGFPEEGWDGDVGTLIVNAARWLSPGGSCGSATPQVTSTATNTGTITAEPSVTGTGTTEPTSTGTITSEPTGSVTAQPTATACTLAFTDVPEGSTFYSDIRCLACRGIINGYTTGCETGNPCFRPGNLVTRGQLAKIVANAANFTEPTTGQQYEDVPEGSTFYEFIWRLSDRGLVNGYPCGGPGEPCGDPALPYFRPNANVTRGQLAKIVANGAGLTEPVTGQQYEDVEIGSTFYEYIGRLSALGVINGYPCGGPGEPCGDPALPYFRPGNNATRGQASKIVANTFFPGCETPLR